MRKYRWNGLMVLALTALVMTGCKKETKGPTPSLSTVEPQVVCNSQLNTWMTISGEGFSPSPKDGLTDKPLLALPEVTIRRLRALDGSGTPGEALVLNPGGTDSENGSVTWTSQNEMAFLVDEQLQLEPGVYELSIKNPTGGETELSDAFVVVPPPVLEAVEPDQVCADQPSTELTLTGTGFVQVDEETPAVSVSPAQSSTAPSDPTTAESVTMVEDSCEQVDGFPSIQICTAVTATFGPDTFEEGGEYTVSITNPASAGCSSSEVVSFSVVPSPLIFYVDPPGVYNGVAVRATIWVAGLEAAPESVVIYPTDATDPQSAEIQLTDVVWDAAHPNRIVATIPSGLTPGIYDVLIYNSDGCNAFLSGKLNVVQQTTLALLNPALDPPFGQEMVNVGVSVLAEEDANLGAGEVNFIPTPRVYLSNDSLETAIPLQAVVFESSSQLAAVVPPIAAGTYDLIVVNVETDGTTTVGFQAGAYRATVVPPPIVDDVKPTLIEADSGQAMTVTGQNFNDPAVTIECIGGETPSAVIDTATTETLNITVDGSGVPTGSTCVVRVTNTANDTWDEWSAMSVTNPAGNLNEFSPGAALNTPRRATALVYANATRKARFLYAIGGDGGAADSAMTTMEIASLGRFGEIGEWRALQTALPTERTMAAAYRKDNFVYHMGGMDSTGAATNEMLRAEILDPLVAPEITDVDLFFAATPTGLPVGAWIYMVAPVFDAADADNPGGEGLPSEAFTLYAPDVPEGVEIELTFSTVMGADGTTPAASYRIYRTSIANGTFEDMVLLATVDGTATGTITWLDANATPEDETKMPLRTGALGEWHDSGYALNTPRAAFGFADASEEGCQEMWYLFGGITDTATESDTYEVIEPDSFTITEFTATGISARRELGLFAANNQNSAATLLGACEFYLYAGSGLSGALANPTLEENFYAAQYSGGANGELSTDLATDNFVDAVAADYAGYGAIWSGEKVYAMGGLRSGTVASQVDDGTWSNSLDEPYIANLNSASVNMTQARYLYGFARLGAFMYIVGGVNDTGAVTATSEYNVR